jgi:hypothetical protein
MLASLLGNNQGAGLHALRCRFAENGLGYVIESWIGSGSNQPISPQQLQNVLGEEQVQNMSPQTAWHPITCRRCSPSIYRRSSTGSRPKAKFRRPVWRR